MSAAGELRPRPAPELPEGAHKGSAGRVLFLCGQALMPGAAILSLRAALRAGAGLVTLGCFERELLASVPGAVPEAIFLDLTRSWELDPAWGLGRTGGLPGGLRDRDDHARVVGPGLGAGKRTHELVRRLVLGRDLEGGFEGPMVVDADALNVLAGSPDVLGAYPGPLVLTPHPGEAARLLGRDVPRDEQGRIECALELARRARGICCLKGAGTVVTDGERVHVNRTGNPGMATAGTGDVLSGVLGAYLAACVALPGGGGEGEESGLPWTPFDAAVSAVHVHGLAGDLAADALGRRALVASDLVDHLPAAQRTLSRD